MVNGVVPSKLTFGTLPHLDKLLYTPAAQVSAVPLRRKFRASPRKSPLVPRICTVQPPGIGAGDKTAESKIHSMDEIRADSRQYNVGALDLAKKNKIVSIYGRLA